MALIDVSDLLLDPDFADSFTIVRLAETVGDDGRAVRTETRETVMGVVQPYGSTTQITPDAAQVMGPIEIHTQAQLRGATAFSAADQVEWNGHRYSVRVVNDWSRFGAGFYHAVCDFRPLTG
jgi:galactose-6-phosphate isomerase